MLLFPGYTWELTCVTLTSKNAVTPRDQKPPALKSSPVSGLVTALLRLNHSLFRGCSCGWTSTLVQSLPISEVSRLLRLSCLYATNPYFLHDWAWQTVYPSPQTYLLGKSDRGILYLKRRESLNSLFSTKPWSTRGTAVSHELAPLLVNLPQPIRRKGGINTFHSQFHRRGFQGLMLSF